MAHYTGSLGIDRAGMPQLSGTVNGEYRTSAEMVPEFTRWLRDRGVTVTPRQVPAESLKPTQSTGDMRAIRGIADALKSGEMANVKPVTVSSDNRVLDGHHNWAGRLLADAEGRRADMPVNRVGLPMTELLGQARAFAREQGIAPRGTGEFANPQYAARDATFNPAEHPRGQRGRFAHVPGTGLVDTHTGQLADLTDEQYAAHTAAIERRLNDALARGESTDAKYAIDADRGIWQPERARLHKQIVNDLYARQSRGVPAQGKAVIAGGLGGAGKTTVLTKHAGIDPAGYVTLNPDDVKEEMIRRGLVPHVEGLSPMESAPLVHEESSHITNLLAKRAYMDHKNVIWDITMSRKGSVQRRVDEMRAAGYGDVTGVFVDIPVETSVQRAMARHRRALGTPEGGRYVPPAIIRKSASSRASSANRETFDAMRGQFDHWSLYDNSGAAPRKVDSG